MLTYNPVTAGNIQGTTGICHDKALIRALSAKFIPPDAKLDPTITTTPSRTLFVGRLAPSVTQDILADTFRPYGTVLQCRIIVNNITGQSRGYAFVEMESQHDVNAAIRACHGIHLHGQHILVDTEHGRTVTGWIPRRLGGGLGGKKESGQMRFGGRHHPFKYPLQSRLPSTGRDDSKRPWDQRDLKCYDSSSKRHSANRVWDRHSSDKGGKGRSEVSKYRDDRDSRRDSTDSRGERNSSRYQRTRSPQKPSSHFSRHSDSKYSSRYDSR
ncbi:small nuclear ribonucleoprotein 35kDa (U11 U12) [Batrachochytrium dendrobatidis]|nr:small nuclear ribonucleoprotein 35kDa (U11 U12) [Batrachochytrium dendrobatidis]KAK5672536.1 small nuclear ribonucleoprotein 35kDa (U11 U12) [Batrachochytrium dendrobatidis]